MSLKATSSQTVGPFFRIGLNWLYTNNLTSEASRGQKIEVSGRILDADRQPIPDAILEVWQANAEGKYAHPEDTQDKPLEPGFQGYGRIGVDENGAFAFTTVKPGPVPGPDGKLQAPHIAVSVFARGLELRLVTRIYFPDESAANSNDSARKMPPSKRVRLPVSA